MPHAGSSRRGDAGNTRCCSITGESPQFREAQDVQNRRYVRGAGSPMDPLVDQWRAHFYPEIDDWSAYDSPVAEVRPDAFDAIVEIGAAPRLARLIERNPELLDSLRRREFTDLDLPGRTRWGVRGDRAAWPHTPLLDVRARRCGDEGANRRNPAQDASDTADTVRNWSNDKAFQIGMHTLRGNLTPVEAGTALANVAEASIAVVLSAVEEDFVDRRGPHGEGGIAAVARGERGGVTGYGADALRVRGRPRRPPRGALPPLPRSPQLRGAACSSSRFRAAARHLRFARLPKHQRSAASADELLSLTRARCVFESVRRRALRRGAA